MKKVIVFILILVIFWLSSINLSQVNFSLNRIEAATPTQHEVLPQTNFKAPAFNLTGLDGKMYSLSRVKGTPIVINFWASWCGPCKIEAPELVKLHKQYKDKIEVYAINVTGSDSFNAAKQFSEEYGFEFPVLIDKGDEVSNNYNVVAIPTTFFVNKDGVIVDKITGYGGAEILSEKFNRLLKQ